MASKATIDDSLTTYFVKNQKQGEEYSDITDRMEKIHFLRDIIGGSFPLRMIVKYVDADRRA